LDCKRTPKGLIKSQKFIGLVKQEYIRRQLRAQPAESVNQATQQKPNLAGRIGKGKSTPRTEQNTPRAEKSKGSCGHCGKANHPTDKCYFLGKTKCGMCGKFSHATKDCWGKKRKLSDGEASASTSKKAKVEETHAVAEDTIDPFIDTVDGEDSIFATEDDQPTGTIVLSDLENNFDSTACNSEKSNETLDVYEWLADSATTSHVANKREVFTEYTPQSHATVGGVGNTKVSAKGRGTVLLEASCDGHKYNLRLEHVLHIPENKNNLLSLGRWAAAGGTFANTGGTLRLTTKGGKTIAEGMRKENNLFKMLVKVREQHKTHPVNAEAAFATAERLESWETWHKRFGHVSYSGLQRLLEANLVEGFKVDTQTPQPDCVACTEAKHAEEPYKKKVNRDTMPGELTHIDLWGKYDVTSINGHQYFILFVDDTTRYMTTHFLKGKDEAVQVVKDYLAHLAANGKPPKETCTDRGTEFINEPLMQWCREHSIDNQVTAPYSPTQNSA
jgi:hypothetical protein